MGRKSLHATVEKGEQLTMTTATMLKKEGKLEEKIEKLKVEHR